ncbi:MAG: NF038129 family PEP-CTERM protein [Vicinamibacterales bacterium]
MRHDKGQVLDVLVGQCTQTQVGVREVDAFAGKQLLTLALSTTLAYASPFSFSVSVDTSALQPLPGPFWLDFLLLSGGDPLSTRVEISQFSAPGILVGAPVAIGVPGGVSGNLATELTLSDSGFVNEFYQQFTPGGLLSFLVTLTPPAAIGATPDNFSFAILQGQPPAGILTAGPFNELLSVDITSTSLSIGNVSTYASTDPAGVVVTATPVPEPTSMLLLGSGLIAAIARRRRRA